MLQSFGPKAQKSIYFRDTNIKSERTKVVKQPLWYQHDVEKDKIQCIFMVSTSSLE